MPSLSNTHVAHQTSNKIVYISKKLKVIYVSSILEKVIIILHKVNTVLLTNILFKKASLNGIYLRKIISKVFHDKITFIIIE